MVFQEGSQLSNIGESAFSECPIEEVVFSNQCQLDYFRANHLLSGLKKVALPEGIESIGRECFKKSELEEIVIPKSVKTIEWSAFLECRSLRKVVFEKVSHL